MRISNRSSYFECVKEVTNKLQIGWNEMKGIDRVWLVVAVIIAMLYYSDMHNKDGVKSKGGKEVEEGIEHRVANPMSKRMEERKAEEES